MKRRDLIRNIALGSIGLQFCQFNDNAANNIVSSEKLIIDEITLQYGQGTSDVKFSYGKLDTRPFLLVRIKSGDFVGYGEVVNKNLIKLEKVAGTIIGKDARLLDALLPEVDTVGHFAREPLSMALYDLVSKAAGVPFNVLLGGKKRSNVTVMPVIFPKSPEHAAERTKHFVSQGMKNIKFKMYGEFEEDLPNLKAIRDVMPKEGFINGDANKGYKDWDKFLKYLPDFEQAGIDYLEDPFDGTLEQYAELKEHTSIKIIMDVFARSNKNLRKIISTQAGDIVNLHPNHQSGFANALRKAHALEIMGYTAWVGGTGYYGVGTAAYQHLASVVGTTLPCGEIGALYDHGSEYSLVKEPLPIKDGEIILQDKPGLGIEIDETSVSKMLIEEIKIEL